jgi:hemolysin-activating ACP:hemolysin acyltransferase
MVPPIPPRLQAITLPTADAALAVLVQLSLKAPAFAGQRFGLWARVLIGQVNRRHYLILLEDGRPVGFGGWFPARKAEAEAWLVHNTDIPVAPDAEADCAIVNAFMAPSPQAARFLRDAMLEQGHQFSRLYGKRVMPDGRRRLVRLANSRRQDRPEPG